MKDLKPWEVLDSEVILDKAPYLVVRQDKVRLADGRVVEDYYQVDLVEHVVIFAETSDGRVLMERNYKHGVKRVNLTLPAGYLEKGEAPLATAKRELLEETGYEADGWRSLGAYVMSANQGAGKAHIFAAVNARFVQPPDDGDLEDIEVVLLSREELKAAFQRGDIATVSTAATVGLALNKELFSV
jgi:ADP-ribose diphosphatase